MPFQNSRQCQANRSLIVNEQNANCRHICSQMIGRVQLRWDAWGILEMPKSKKMLLHPKRRRKGWTRLRSVPASESRGSSRDFKPETFFEGGLAVPLCFPSAPCEIHSPLAPRSCDRYVLS
jgi:hypothetical protein